MLPARRKCNRKAVRRISCVSFQGAISSMVRFIVARKQCPFPAARASPAMTASQQPAGFLFAWGSLTQFFMWIMKIRSGWDLTWLLLSGAPRKGWSTQGCRSSSTFLGQVSVEMGGCKAPFPHWKQTLTIHLKPKEVIVEVQKLPFSPVSASGLCDRGSQQSTNCSLGRWPKSCFAQGCCRALMGFVCCPPSPPHQLRCSRVSVPSSCCTAPQSLGLMRTLP